jgi:asparagine synthase (glutamine-hydrolysing)
MNIFLSKLPWYNNDNVWATGFIRTEEKYLIKDELLNYFTGIDTLFKFEQILKTANGQFAVIIKSSGEIWAATDRLRNYPLFYTNYNNQFIISDDCYKLAGMQSEKQFNSNAVYFFLATGYVINDLTLINNIYQVEAGQYMILGESFSRNFYYDPNCEPIIDKDLETGAKELKKIISDIFKGHLKALNNRFIAIPLSGGFDSRLIAAMCAAYHPENVLCYTYGIRNNPEVAPAKETAKRLGLKWINIVYDSGLIKEFLHDGFFEDYYPYASNLSSMCFLQDYFAVRYLKENNLVPDNCIFMPGFSGDMLAGSHLIPAMKNKMDKNQVARLIFREYFGLVKLGNQKKSNVIKFLVDKIPSGKYETWKVIETWDIKERQAKFVVNSAKVFSFFGYEYVLPLFDNMLLDFFSNLPFNLKLNKKLYDHVLTEYLFKDLNLNLKNEINSLPSQKAFQRFKERLKPLLPNKMRNLFIQLQSPVLYDEITKLMLEEFGHNPIIPPKQSNYYNSYITQWYLLKTQEHLKIKEMWIDY